MDGLVSVLEGLLPDDWDHDAGTYGMEFTLVCPCGHQIEQDGVCPDGHVSPLREAGMI